MLAHPKIVWYSGLALLVGGLGLSMSYGDSSNRVGMVLAVAPVFGLVFFLASSAFAKFCGRPITKVDAFRILCWTVLGCAEGVRETSFGYYAYYWPQYSSTAYTISVAVIVYAVVGIATATICGTAAARTKPKQQ